MYALENHISESELKVSEQELCVPGIQVSCRWCNMNFWLTACFQLQSPQLHWTLKRGWKYWQHVALFLETLWCLPFEYFSLIWAVRSLDKPELPEAKNLPLEKLMGYFYDSDIELLIILEWKMTVGRCIRIIKHQLELEMELYKVHFNAPEVPIDQLFLLLPNGDSTSIWCLVSVKCSPCHVPMGTCISVDWSQDFTDQSDHSIEDQVQSGNGFFKLSPHGRAVSCQLSFIVFSI